MFWTILQDLRYGTRGLRRTPVFTAVVALSLALGIGANTALFSVIDARYLRKLPVPNPDELVSLSWSQKVRNSQLGDGLVLRTNISRLSFETLREQNTTLSEVFAYTYPFRAAARIERDPETVSAQLISGNYFSGLGVPAAIGRMLAPDDDRSIAEPVVVISDQFWERRMSRDRDVIGRSIQIESLSATVVGIVSADFRGLSSRGMPDVLIPVALEAQIRGTNDTQSQTLQVMGRMKPGVTPEQVRSSLEGVFRSTADLQVAPNVAAEPLQLTVQDASRGESTLGGDFPRFILMLGAVFGLLLLIVCLNVASMLIARAATRDYEIGVRLTMGAGRRRLIRQLLTESMLLALIGGAIGVAVAYWSRNLLSMLVAQDLDLRIDPRVLGFTAAISVITGVLFGLVPAIQATRSNTYGLVKAGSRNMAGNRSRLGPSVLVAQVAMSVVLMVGAGLLVRTLGKLPNADPGFESDNLLVFRVNPSNGKYNKGAVELLYEQLLQGVRSVPGVVSATFSSSPLVSTYSEGGNILLPGRGQGLGSAQAMRELAIHPNFFEVMGLQVLRGRALTPADREGAPLVAVLSESAARALYPDADAIGKHAIMFGSSAQELDVEIVGVVEEVGVSTLGKDISGTVFLSDAQERSLGRLTEVSFEVRTAGDTSSVVLAVRQAAQQIDPNLLLFGFTTQAQLIDERVAPVFRIALTWALLAALALLLTGIGLYGLISYNAARRTNEIGIRMALGARSGQIVSLVMRQFLFLVAAGVVAGTVISIIVNQTIRAFVFGVDLYDPTTMVAVILLILGVTAVAGYLPARRSCLVDPSSSLRSE